MDRDNSKDFERILKAGLREPRIQISEDQRNFLKNQNADNAQVIGLIRAMRAEIKGKLAKHPAMQVNFDPSILNGDLASMNVQSLQSLLTNLIQADVAVNEASAEGNNGILSSFIKGCKDWLSGKKDCHNHNDAKAAGQILKPLFTGVVPPGFVITPNKKKLPKSIEI